MKIEFSRPALGRLRLSKWAPVVGAALALPLAGWLLFGLNGGAESASPRPVDFEAQVPARDFILAHGTSDQVLERRARNRREETTVTVSSGDTLIGMLEDAGVTGGEAFAAVQELQNVYSPRDLRPGQAIQLALLHDDTGTSGTVEPRLASLRLRASAEQDVKVTRTEDGRFQAAAVARALSRTVHHADSTIESSLFAAGDKAGVPARVMLDVIHQYSYAVDFQRDLRKGDHFEILNETFTEAGGRVAKTGPLLFASLEVQGKRLAMYRFETDDGEVGYYNPDGESMRRLLMRTPIDGARLSSGYGMRKHPIKGYSRMHEGVDFAAPRGTPIYASGNGKVVRANRYGSYGNYLKIRHADGFQTVYAHLKGFAKEVHNGARVEQGEVVAYVGTTGSSTGPHLHYEVLRHGKPVNPRSLDLPTGRRLKGDELERFQQVMADIDRLRDGAQDGTRIAKACGEADDSDC